jgi:hypothetical protein
MQLDYAYLAENAHRGEDGKLYVFAADIANLESEQLPAAIILNLVARLSVSPSEVNDEHTCKIELSHPDGSRQGMLENTKLKTVSNPEDPEADTGAGLIVKLGLVFPNPGRYLVHLSVDGHEMKSLPLRLTYKPKSTQG